LPAWSALILALQGRGDVRAATRLLESLETGEAVPMAVANPADPSKAKAKGKTATATATSEVRGKTAVLPPPSARTYVGLIQMAARAGHPEQAEAYLDRFRKYITGLGGSAEAVAAVLGPVKENKNEVTKKEKEQNKE
jgi:hypothetical protein